ncbi:MAG TPA: family 20 glycosylhydrolase [Pyrinomonadaceae bacterium]|jgi:hexosaminidase
MKKLTFVFLLCLVFCAWLRAQNAGLNIIPQPKSASRLKGEFKFSRKTKIVARDETGRKSAALLNDLLLKNYGFKLELTTAKKNPSNAIVFEEQKNLVGNPAAEFYGIYVIDKGIIVGGKETGQFYALQTLMQLLPVDFKTEAKIPAIDISDAPRFPYRGMHLDVGRHFMPVDFVKKYIDLMSQYKFNYFHWHLTEDQGWRIEIKKYPRLTEIGSKRKESVKERNLQPYIGDNTPVEGFYTQEQIRDVVAYAKARFITVIPEIELPGHSSAALAAYPELGCKENYQYKVQTTWGIFKEVYCPTEATFQFLEDVLTETIALFPDSPYVHIGGDEVLKDHWKESAFVQELKAKENLKDEHEVQSYFIRRVEKFINSKGKKIIGWDEILEGGLAPNATVMSWRGEKGGITAAKSKHDVIMTPTDFLYFDYGQGDPKYEPLNIGNYVPLEKVYSYNPQPKELTDEEKRYILGAQGNVWTEYMKTPEKVEYMVFPRMLALSEVVWSPVEQKNYADFTRRLQYHFQRLDKQNVNYRIPAPGGLQNMILGDADKATIDLKPATSGGKIYYTTDGSEPTDAAKLYEKPFELTLKPNEKAEIKTVVVNEKGRKSVVYAATVLRREKLKAIELNEKKPGVDFQFYIGEFKTIKDFYAAKPIASGETKSIQFAQFAEKTNKSKDPFGVDFSGYIFAPEDAIYEFQMETDDGAILEIGDETLIDLDGIGTKRIQNQVVPLSKGYHQFRLRYFHAEGDAILNLRWSVKGQGLRRINGSELFH